MSPAGVSVIVPALDEAARLPTLLARLRELPLRDVVVVDGGSVDGTPAIARAAGVHVVTGTRGRARQMNEGARAAGGEILWFLHADALPPRGAVARIREALVAPDVVGGAFHIRTVADAGGVRLGPLLRIADVRSRLTRHPYGDQGIFVRREAFEGVGGFPDQPIFEDLDFARALWRRGRLVTVPREIRVSGRRFERRPLYYMALMNVFPTLYRLGIPPETLTRWYRDER